MISLHISFHIDCCRFTDLLIKSKSGTGKTLVFCTIILEKYCKTIHIPQSIIIVPTREVAIQVEMVLNSLGSSSAGNRHFLKFLLLDF